jgi:hypothetical protein
VSLDAIYVCFVLNLVLDLTDVIEILACADTSKLQSCASEVVATQEAGKSAGRGGVCATAGSQVEAPFATPRVSTLGGNDVGGGSDIKGCTSPDVTGTAVAE